MTEGIFPCTLPLELESGEILTQHTLAYTTYGQLNKERSNVVWVIHALTGDSKAATWWSGVVGADGFFNSSQFYIVCANLLGSSYGSTSPLSENPSTNTPYFYSFPQLSTYDMAISLEGLRKHLQLDRIHTLMGGSLGGQVALEWAVLLGNSLQHAVFVATTAKTSPWVIGCNEAQRMAIESDATWGELHADAGKRGLETARAIAMLTYRHPNDLNTKQKEKVEKLDDFLASSYLRYQGAKLANRFNAFSYWTLSKAMDSHDVGRNRGGVREALQRISAKVLAVGVSSDLLFLPGESEEISRQVSKGWYKEIQSQTGHDAFLIEFSQLNQLLEDFFRESSS